MNEQSMPCSLCKEKKSENEMITVRLNKFKTVRICKKCIHKIEPYI
ncbi:MAG: hypothetical protein ABH851_07955 [Methanobacteriota archaeon]